MLLHAVSAAAPAAATATSWIWDKSNAAFHRVMHRINNRDPVRRYQQQTVDDVNEPQVGIFFKTLTGVNG